MTHGPWLMDYDSFKIQKISFRNSDFLFEKFWIWDFEEMNHQFGKSWFGFSWKILKLGENIWSYVSDNNFIEPPNNLRSIIYGP